MYVYVCMGILCSFFSWPALNKYLQSNGIFITTCPAKEILTLQQQVALKVKSKKKKRNIT